MCTLWTFLALRQRHIKWLSLWWIREGAWNPSVKGYLPPFLCGIYFWTKKVYDLGGYSPPPAPYADENQILCRTRPFFNGFLEEIWRVCSISGNGAKQTFLKSSTWKYFWGLRGCKNIFLWTICVVENEKKNSLCVKTKLNSLCIFIQSI